MSIQSKITTMMAVGTAIASQNPAIKQRQENKSTVRDDDIVIKKAQEIKAKREKK